MLTKYSIGEFSKKTGTTIRTLRYYDEIGILKPSFISEAGRRFYSNDDLIILQRIVSLKYLGYSLDQVKEFFKTNKWDLKESLSFQKQVMLQKKKQIEEVIRALDHALNIMDEHSHVEPSIFITLINNIQNEDEQKEWLKGLLDEELVENMFDVPEENKLAIEKRWVEISAKLKSSFGDNPKSDYVQELIGGYMEIVREISGDELELMAEISDVEVEDDTWLFHSPFTKEEEEWVAQALAIYLEKRGITITNQS